jgi:glycine cleavage system aminomethyltransferase T/glycine/D-amino acid oxidase-like deaminating enzyme
MVAVPHDAEVVVIGGGIVGCSVAYHVAKAGCRNVLLLEKHQIGSGTTWHSAALVTVLRGSPTLAALARYSAGLYASLEKETGQATGWRQNGHLTIAASKDRLESLRHSVSGARSFDLDVEMIGPSDVAAKWPLLNIADVHGALWSPSSGQTNPTDTCQALLKGARALGARIVENMPVEGFEIANGRLSGVRTQEGIVRCEKAVICSGLWSRQVAGLAGVAAPLYACEHLYMLTDTIAGVTSSLPAIRDSDAYLYIREDVGGLLVGCFEPNPKPLPLERIPKNSGYVLFNEDWDHFEPMMQNAVHRVPALGAAGMRSFINGPESFTLDGAPLVGESPEVRGLFVAAGMNSSGVVYGGGVGWALAEWLTRGRPPIDLWAVDIRRYSHADNTLKGLAERIPEVLAKHFEIPWPGLDYDTVRAVRRTPLHGMLKGLGAYFTQRAGWERPAWFAVDGAPNAPNHSYGPQNWFPLWCAEHLAARTGVALFDQTPFSKLLLQGRDSEGFLQRVCANDLARPIHAVTYTPLLNPDGGIESDLTITRLGLESYLLVTGSQQGVRDAHWLRSQIQSGENICLTDMTSAYAVIGVAGPRSRELLSSVSNADFSNQSFPFQTAQHIEIGYGIALAIRVSYSGELGWELYIPAEFSVGILETLVEAGRAFDLKLAGVNAMGSLRIERGFRSWGHDIGPTVSPLEAGLGFAVDFDKCDDFLGRDALVRQREQGIARRLLSFVFDTPEAFPHHYEPIYRDGRRCGAVTSATFGHSLGRAVALGWVTAGRVDAEGIAASRFEIEVADRRYAVTAHLRAPVDPGGQRLRS